MLLEVGPSLIVFRRPFSHLYFAEQIGYWAFEYDFELRLFRPARGIFAGWHTVELLDIPAFHRSSHFMETIV